MGWGLSCSRSSGHYIWNVILGYIRHHEADDRYITTYQEKCCHQEMCTGKDYPASRNFLPYSQWKEWEDHCLCQQFTLSSPQWHSGNMVRFSWKGDGSLAASLSFHRRFDGYKQSTDASTAPNISHPSATGMRYWSWCGHFFPGNMKQIKTISKKESIQLNFVLEAPRSFSYQPLFNTPKKRCWGFCKYHLLNIE